MHPTKITEQLLPQDYTQHQSLITANLTTTSKRTVPNNINSVMQRYHIRASINNYCGVKVLLRS